LCIDQYRYNICSININKYAGKLLISKQFAKNCPIGSNSAMRPGAVKFAAPK